MTGIIILAAGASSRLGRAKQRLIYQGKSLLKHAIDAAINAAVGPVIVVIGANENEILTEIETEEVLLAQNRDWQEGIASSIHVGLIDLLHQFPDIENAILMVCDQPYVEKELLIKLVDTKRTSKKLLVACSYKETIGVPALFDKQFFPELLSLKGDEGGKKVLLQHLDEMGVVSFPAGATDIDTETDYEALIK